MPKRRYARDHYRIPYPIQERPSGRIHSLGSIRIVDLSESGMKFELLSNLKQFSPKMMGTQEQPYRGSITFSDGESILIEGHITRREKSGLYVMRFAQLIDAAKLMQQQRYLIEKYGKEILKVE